MTFRPSALLVLAAFLAVFRLLLQAGRSVDLVLEAVAWIAIAYMSTDVVVRLYRGEPYSTDQTAGLPRTLGRWLMGESGKR